MSTSPSAFTERTVASNPGLAAASRRCISRRGDRVRQPRHTTFCSPPCSSRTSMLPAAWCSPSTFCVTTPVTWPCRCRLRDRPVPRVRLGGGDGAPPEVAARPVAPRGLDVGGELAVGHRCRPAQRAARPAVVRDAGVRRQAGAGEHDDAAAGDDLGEPGRCARGVVDGRRRRGGASGPVARAPAQGRSPRRSPPRHHPPQPPAAPPRSPPRRSTHPAAHPGVRTTPVPRSRTGAGLVRR